MSKSVKGVLGFSTQLLVDPNGGYTSNGYQMEWAKVPDIFRVGSFLVTTTANAAQNATTITVAALGGPIVSGKVLDFGGTLFARVTADAAQGATTVTVAALGSAIPTGSTATVAGDGPKVVPAGSVMGKAGSTGGKKMYPRAAGSNPGFGILKEDVMQGNPVTGYTGHGVWESGFFWENRLPDAVANAGTLPTQIKTELGAMFKYKMAENNAPTLP